MGWGWKSPEDRAKEFQRTESADFSCWRDIYLFDSKNTMERSNEYVTEIRGEKVPLFEGCYRGMFRKDNRLFLAIDCWKEYPAYLRRSVDQYWPDYPDFDRDYMALECGFQFAHQRAGEYLMGVAETEGFDGAAISMAGELCRQMVKTLHDRQQLWGDDYVIGDWPSCHPDWMGLPPDMRQTLLAGKGQVDKLSCLLARWRAPVKKLDLLPAPAPENALPVPTSPTNKSKSKPTAPGSVRLRACELRAWNQYQHATQQKAELATDAQVYEWLQENRVDDDHLSPTFRTWQGLLGKARTALGVCPRIAL